jgi:hypothetical protein
MNKFGSPDEEDFMIVQEVIEKMAKQANQLLSARVRRECFLLPRA